MRLEIFPWGLGERGTCILEEWGVRDRTGEKEEEKEGEVTEEEEKEQEKEVHAGGPRISGGAEVKFLGSQLKFERRT